MYVLYNIVIILCKRRKESGVTHMKQRVYLCIDLKSFYASVECVERGLDPMTTNLVVADPERSAKTICLAITPAMKQLVFIIDAEFLRFPKESVISWQSPECSYILIMPQKYMPYI